MLYIKKKAPPQSYQKAVAEIKSSSIWRSIQDGDTIAIRGQFDLLPKSEIRDTLLAEQHYLCAYCMKRIRNNEDGTKIIHMTIEHWFPLSQDKERALDYKNFLGVCKGGADVAGPRSRILCCDASKGDATNITVNPLDKAMMQHIAYTKDGTIYCLLTADPKIAEAINDDLKKVLRLNGNDTGQDTATGLVKGRRDAYKQAQNIYKDLAARGRLTSVQISKKIRELKQLDEYPEFAGTILFFLERKRKALINQGK